MLTDPLKLSKEGLSALTDTEFAEQRKKVLETMDYKKKNGQDFGQEELLYKAFETERTRRLTGQR